MREKVLENFGDFNLANFESDSGRWNDNWEKIRDLKPSGQSGAMEARRRDSSELACVKVLKEQKKSERRSRFYREAVALAMLGGSGLPKLIETNATRYSDKTYNLYLAMEFVKGEDLTEYVSEEAFSSREAVELTIEICGILKIAHAKGVFHRDIKPDNVKIRDQKGEQPFRVCLLDFGIAFYEDQQDFRTQIDQEIGNRFLRLPEFAPGSERKDDARSDVTMVAGLLFYMLTSKKPCTLIDHNGNLPHQRVDARKRLLQSGLDKDAILGIFDRAFQGDIAKRFQSISEFENSLSDLRRRQSAAVRPASTENVLERLAHSSSQEVLNRKAVLSNLLQEADRELRQHYAQFRHGIVMAQTDRSSDPQAGTERTTLIFSMGARPDVSIRVGVSATAVGPETKISIHTEGSTP
jgi:serine/threonine protein kinase